MCVCVVPAFVAVLALKCGINTASSFKERTKESKKETQTLLVSLGNVDTKPKRAIKAVTTHTHTHTRIHTHTHTHTHIYIYIYREREREKETV